MKQCEHKTAVVVFKTVILYNVKTKHGAAILPKAIKTKNLCVKNVYCLECESELCYGRQEA